MNNVTLFQRLLYTFDAEETPLFAYFGIKQVLS